MDASMVVACVYFAVFSIGEDGERVRAGKFTKGNLLVICELNPEKSPSSELLSERNTETC